jgi:hypothetical protein
MSDPLPGHVHGRADSDVPDAWLRSALRPESGPSPPPVPGVQAGGTLGPYRILEELGRGGQAAVYLAEDTRRGCRGGSR